MLGKNWIHRLMTTFTAAAMLCAYSAAAIAAPRADADITVTGQVTVNGQPAVSNSTVVSGSTITTGANSGAVVSLGTNGKIELIADTSLTLKFTDNSIVVMLTSGKVRVINSAGIGTTVSTRSATVVADTGQANSFSVDIGCADDLKCSQTFVETTTGLVTLRHLNNVKQVAAGTDAASGTPSQTGCKPCMRPGSAPPVPVAGFGTGAIVGLLGAVGAGVAAALLLRSDNDINAGGPTNVVSPTA